jgi:L-threonylcarbamoyladenylate synthase
VTAQVVADDDSGRTAAIAVLRAGGVVALPTDTVYGIAVAIDTPGGIERLFQVKRRPPDKSIALLIADAEQAATMGVVTDAAEALAAACWPGGLTLVLTRRPGVVLPDVLTGGAATVGVRVPDHAAPRALADAVGPLPTTSANVSGQPEARDAAEIVALLGDAIDLVLDGGPAHGGPASTVIDASGDSLRVIRVGAIPVGRLTAVLEAARLPHALEAPVQPE